MKLLFFGLALALAACASPSPVDPATGLRVEEMGMGGYTYGSGKMAFSALHVSAIGPCFIGNMEACPAEEAVRPKAPDEWSLTYHARDVGRVSPATIQAWNRRGSFLAKGDEDDGATLYVSQKFPDARFTRDELLKAFAREVPRFRRFLRENR